MTANDNQTEDFTYSRIFDAPRELVWEIYTTLEHLSKWWGPQGFTWISGTLDFRPGGVFHYGMRGPTGQEMWGKFNYREISKPDRIVFTNSFADKDGNTVRAPFFSDWPLEVLNTVTFTEEGGKTTIHLRGRPFNATAEERARFEATKPSMNQGFGATFDKLVHYLSELKA
ncbi:MAG TPA: SRPBCC domain-containing protein [Rhizomicrobium sp.]|nr:SRPBCC domain-containing protein [Rhizomicrobium sp.]